MRRLAITVVALLFILAACGQGGGEVTPDQALATLAALPQETRDRAMAETIEAFPAPTKTALMATVIEKVKGP